MDGGILVPEGTVLEDQNKTLRLHCKGVKSYLSLVSYLVSEVTRNDFTLVCTGTSLTKCNVILRRN